MTTDTIERNTCEELDIVQDLSRKTENMSINEIEVLLNEVNSLHAARKKEAMLNKQAAKEEALDAISKIVKTHSISLAEILDLLTDAHAVYAGHYSNAQNRRLFVDPNDKSKFWLGVGRRPAWINNLIEQGATLESLEVEMQYDDDEQQHCEVFYNPKKPSQQWIGKGRKPFWFKELTSNGIDPYLYRTKV